MFEADMLLAFIFMALLFLRQVAILKKPNKINYAPLMLGIGAISSVIHFIVLPDTSDVILLLRESFIPLLVSLLLYIVMNILHQTQLSENARAQNEFSRVLVGEISQLKEFILELENRMYIAHQEERGAQEEIRQKFKDDIKALDAIKLNQEKFLEKFFEVEEWHKGVDRAFSYFSEVQLPELDGVVHKHIDILRIAEQDHYNKLSQLLQKGLQNRSEVTKELEELKESLTQMKRLSSDVAKTVTEETLQRLSSVTKAFEFQMGSLKSHTEGLTTSLQESESRLSAIRSQSEMVMKQMLLSSKKMDELEKQNRGLHNVYASLEELVEEVERVKSEYLSTNVNLLDTATNLASEQTQHLMGVQKSIQDLGDALQERVDEALHKLHKEIQKQLQEGGEDVTKNVHFLAKRAQFQKGYSQESTEPPKV